MSAKNDISLYSLACLFRLPFHEAAKQIGLCQTSLKKICRRHNIMRWPQRKLRCIDRRIASLRAELTYMQDDGNIGNELERLRAERADIYKGVPMHLQEESINMLIEGTGPFAVGAQQGGGGGGARGSDDSDTDEDDEVQLNDGDGAGSRRKRNASKNAKNAKAKTPAAARQNSAGKARPAQPALVMPATSMQQQRGMMGMDNGGGMMGMDSGMIDPGQRSMIMQHVLQQQQIQQQQQLLQPGGSNYLQSSMGGGMNPHHAQLRMQLHMIQQQLGMQNGTPTAPGPYDMHSSMMMMGGGMKDSLGGGGAMSMEDVSKLLQQQQSGSGGMYGSSGRGGYGYGDAPNSAGSMAPPTPQFMAPQGLTSFNDILQTPGSSAATIPDLGREWGVLPSSSGHLSSPLFGGWTPQANTGPTPSGAAGSKLPGLQGLDFGNTSGGGNAKIEGGSGGDLSGHAAYFQGLGQMGNNSGSTESISSSATTTTSSNNNNTEIKRSSSSDAPPRVSIDLPPIGSQGSGMDFMVQQPGGRGQLWLLSGSTPSTGALAVTGRGCTSPSTQPLTTSSAPSHSSNPLSQSNPISSSSSTNPLSLPPFPSSSQQQQQPQPNSSNNSSSSSSFPPLNPLSAIGQGPQTAGSLNSLLGGGGGEEQAFWWPGAAQATGGGMPPQSALARTPFSDAAAGGWIRNVVSTPSGWGQPYSPFSHNFLNASPCPTSAFPPRSPLWGNLQSPGILEGGLWQQQQQRTAAQAQQQQQQPPPSQAPQPPNIESVLSSGSNGSNGSTVAIGANPSSIKLDATPTFGPPPTAVSAAATASVPLQPLSSSAANNNNSNLLETTASSSAEDHSNSLMNAAQRGNGFNRPPAHPNAMAPPTATTAAAAPRPQGVSAQ